jgi:hypothetical protein
LTIADKWQDKDLGLMIRLLNPYSTDMKQQGEDMQAEGTEAQGAQPAPDDARGTLAEAGFSTQFSRTVSPGAS